MAFCIKEGQFPLSVFFAMSINKSQGHSCQRVGLFLDKPVFSHGQLYVAISRVTSRNGLGILTEEKDYGGHFNTKNVVYKEIFNNLLIGNTKLV